MKETIKFEEFLKFDIRIGTVVKAESVEGSEKLILASVELEKGNVRQLVAGIGKSYEPVELEGRQLVILANLEPRKIFGFWSEGMILAVGDESGPVILSPLTEVESGKAVT